MKSTPNPTHIWFPLALAAAIVVGIFIGNRY